MRVLLISEASLVAWFAERGMPKPWQRNVGRSCANYGAVIEYDDGAREILCANTTRGEAVDLALGAAGANSANILEVTE